jgi:hypothetical protein
MISWLTPTQVGSMGFGVTSSVNLNVSNGNSTTANQASVSGGITNLFNQTGETFIEIVGSSYTNFTFSTIVSTLTGQTGTTTTAATTTVIESSVATDSDGNTFTAGTSSSATTSAATVTSAPDTVESTPSTISESSATQTNESSSRQFTLLGQTTTTETAQTQYRDTTTASTFLTGWATASEEESLFVTQTVSTASTLVETTKTRTVVETVVIEDSTTKVGNTYATVYLANYLPRVNPGQEARNEGNELLLGLTSWLYVSDWNGTGIEASPYITSGTQITVSPDIASQDVQIVNFSDEFSTVSDAEITQQIEYETTQGQSTESTSHNFNYFPPKSFTYLNFTTSIAKTLSTWTIRPSQEISHRGNTQTIKNFASNVRATTLAVLQDGRTYSALVSDVGPYVSFTQLSTKPTFESATLPTSEPTITINAEGNTTYRKQGALLLFGALNPGIETDATQDMGACYVVKSCGASIGTEFGSVFYADCPEFPVISSEVYAYRDRQADENGNIGLGVLGQGYANSAGIRVLQSVENELFTIENSTIVWTTTTVTNSSTIATTESASIVVSGDPQKQLVAIKSVLGGKPELYATFYNTAPWRVYKDATGQSLIAGDSATIVTDTVANVQTTQLRAANYLSHVGFEVLLAERNPIPREGSNALNV